VPYARVNRIRIYYEVHGEGEPLLWVGGLGSNILEIPYIIEEYRKRYRFIVYDGRGNGRSDKPAGEYSIAAFADDAAALLDAIGIESAFVYGTSMGGMVAQELILRYAPKVRALILGCTTAGAIRGERPSPETVDTMIRNQSLGGDEAMEAGWALGYSREFIERNREGMRERSRAAGVHAAPPDSYLRQILASAQHDTYDRLHEVRCPVLIIHGAGDLQIPAGNARLLKERIPHAELRILDGLGHGYNLEGQARADAFVFDFLDRQISSERADEAASAVR